jgi:hypothetical protein
MLGPVAERLTLLRARTMVPRLEQEALALGRWFGSTSAGLNAGLNQHGPPERAGRS